MFNCIDSPLGGRSIFDVVLNQPSEIRTLTQKIRTNDTLSEILENPHKAICEVQRDLAKITRGLRFTDTLKLP